MCDDGVVAGVDGIEMEAARIVEVARAGDLAAPVPQLGRWKLRDVLAHLGGVHEWATRIVTDRSMDGPGFRKSKLDGDELIDWYSTAAAELVALLRAVDPAEPCPNFNPGSDKTVRWWVRRQLGEATVHRCDVEAAAEVPTPIDPAVASDLVDEYLDTFVRTRGKQTATAPITLSTVDPARSWTITLAEKPGRVAIAPGAGDTDGALIGPAEDLLLVLWGRRDLDATALSMEGDERAVRAFLGGD